MSVVAVFVPVSFDQAALARDGADLGGLPGHVAGPALREEHGLGAADDEEAGFVALGYAGLAALLTQPGPRLVLAADVEPGQVSGTGSAFGEVEVRELRWSQVQALFADEAAAATGLEAARSLAAGRPLAVVADDDDVVGLVDRWDLLWFAPDELDAARS